MGAGNGEQGAGSGGRKSWRGLCAGGGGGGKWAMCGRGSQEGGGGAALFDEVGGGLRDVGQGLERDGLGLGVLDLDAGVVEGEQGGEVLLDFGVDDELHELIGRDGVREPGAVEVR